MFIKTISTTVVWFRALSKHLGAYRLRVRHQ